MQVLSHHPDGGNGLNMWTILTCYYFMKAVLILVLLVALASCNDHYYLLAREWPPTVCLNTKCPYMENFNGNNLNIHGLWLQYGSAEKCAHPGDCLNIPFDPNSLSAATKNDLTYHWVGVFNPSNGFHDHEWTKHGTCYEKEMTSPSRWLRYFEELGADAYQEKFFRQVITLNQQHAAMQLLKAQGIVPSRTVGYTTVNMLRALGTTTSSSLLACQNVNGKYYWSSYYVCYNKSWQITNCPCSASGSSGEVTCPSDKPIYIPPLS